MKVIGIDPGITGAIAVFSEGRLIYVQDLPTIEVVVAKGTRKRQNAAALADLIFVSGPDHIYLEEVSTRPGEGAVGAFSFGRGFGQIEGIMAGLNIPYTLVRPQKWKTKLGVPADKGGARMIASRLFPDFAEQFARVKDDGRAEAAMIALYGHQTGGNA
jgi:crossover junction endodeoxyribonuclease RuvC